MINPTKIIVDLNQYKITIGFKGEIEPIAVLFNKSPSRNFYLCLIALIVIEMKKNGSIIPINIKKSEIKNELLLIDENILHSKKSRNNLLDLGKGILFVVEERKIRDDGGRNYYDCDDDELNMWKSLFVISPKNTWTYKFAIDSPKVNLSLDKVDVVFNGKKDIDAWVCFLENFERSKHEPVIKEITVPERIEIIESENKKPDYSKAIFDSLPSLPEHKIIGREEDLEKISEKLEEIDCDSQPNRRKIFVIHGLPGVGKTTMSIVISHNKKIQSMFNNGIIWTSLGNNSEPLPLLKSFSTHFGSLKLSNASTIVEAINILREYLKIGKFLLVVDDVWGITDAKLFIMLSNYVPTIITTRIRKIPYLLNLSSNRTYELNVLSEIESLKLLSELVPAIVENHKDECIELVRTLEGLPLAIRVAGYLLREQHDYGLAVPDFIHDLNEGKHLLESEPPGELQLISSETSATVAVLLKKSTDYLTEHAKLCFSLFAHFPSKPVKFKYNDLKEMYEERLKINNPDLIIKEFLNLGLIEPFTKNGTSSIHYLLVLLAKTFT